MTDEAGALDLRIEEVSKRYHAARSRLLQAFPPIDEDTFYAVTSVAEEFGARHTRGLIEKQPDKFGLPTGAFPKEEALAELEKCLNEFIHSSEAMDWAVADKESTRAGDEPVRMMALHGRIAELRINEQTLAYIDAPGERLAFEVIPVENTPRPTPQRQRPRARGRQ